MYTFSVLQPERKRPFWTPRHSWEIMLKLMLDKTECEDVDWIHLAKYRVQSGSGESFVSAVGGEFFD
jgi:hypothetical protein